MVAVQRLLVSICFFVALALPEQSAASGGTYIFVGGTPRERAEVRAALDASRFDWNVVTPVVTITIAPGLDSSAVPAAIALDADLLDAGRFSWGLVQHEYAHQVDFFALDDERRETLAPLLGGRSWWQQTGDLVACDELASERFASTLAWAYWQSADNVMRPQSASDESAALPPAAFRSLLAAVLRR